jgi:serine/threonine protein kinase
MSRHRPNVLKKLGKYELIEIVGRGAMGEVYKAQDPFIGRLVALKTVTSGLLGRPELLERFYQEARSAGTLQHANIVTIYELGKESETPFIAMEFLEGESLESVIDRRPVMTHTQKVGYIVPVCRALDYAHKRGVVHRDIKPGNVMITRDTGVKVVDFGIARLMDSTQTQTNTIIGTLSYMSPQQIRGERADERSDIWATGVLLYELLTYQRPFEGANQAALMLNIANDETRPPSLQELAPGIDPAVEALVMKMLQKDVRQRYQTMEEVLFDFEPVWRRLQDSSVAEMIAGGEELIRGGNFVRARDVLRKALQMDSRNVRAKTLLEQLNAHLKKTTVSEQTSVNLDKARQLLKEGRHAEARIEIDAAQKSDPDNLAAKELIVEVENAAAHARQVLEALRNAKQKLAEGALEEAAQAADQVLELEPKDPQARTLQKQIREMIGEREKRKRLADLLQKGRKLWAEQKFDDCIALLNEAQAEFPGDPEITKLAETAKQENAEHRKRTVLNEAKGQMADQKFDEALATIDTLAKEFPADDAAKKLRELVAQEQEELQRRQKLQTAIAEAQSLVNAEKFPEAIERGEKLLAEYPKHAELTELVKFARAESERLEQKKLVGEALKEVERKIQLGKFAEGLAAAEKLLAQFPGDPGLEAAARDTRAKQKERDRQDTLRQRMGEIRAKINSGDCTAALDLAQQTIATMGPDEQVAQLLRAAEVELEQKREKQRRREKSVSEAQSKMAEGRFSEATRILEAGVASQVFSRKDPTVDELFREIEKRKAAAAPPPVAAQSIAAAVTPPSHDYVVRKGAPEAAAAQDAAKGALAATVVSRPTARARASQESAPAKSAAKRGDMQKEPVELEFATPSARARPPKEESSGGAGVLIAVTAAVVLAGVFVGYRYVGLGGPTQQETSLRMQAQQAEQNKDWPGALADYKNLANLNGKLANDSRTQSTRIEGLIEREASLFQQAQDSSLSGNLQGAHDFYQQAADLHGDREQEALDAIQKVEAEMQPPAPVAPAPAPTVASAPPAPAGKPKSAAAKSSKKAPAKESAKSDSESGAAAQTAAAAKAVDNPACELVASDIPRFLEMADGNRGRGKYSDAEREYSAVLECDAQNDRAKAGLAKARQAEAISGNR